MLKVGKKSTFALRMCFFSASGGKQKWVLFVRFAWEVVMIVQSLINNSRGLWLTQSVWLLRMCRTPILNHYLQYVLQTFRQISPLDTTQLGSKAAVVSKVVRLATLDCSVINCDIRAKSFTYRVVVRIIFLLLSCLKAMGLYSTKSSSDRRRRSSAWRCHGARLRGSVPGGIQKVVCVLVRRKTNICVRKTMAQHVALATAPLGVLRETQLKIK